MAWPAIGVFVGGHGRRMGGVAKGLLLHDGLPLVERVLGACRAAVHPGVLEHVYLVGNYPAAAALGADPYAPLGLPSLPDAPAGVGPIGGLRALLLRARELRLDAVALAVDLPYLGGQLVRRLCLEHPAASALAPRQEGRWQPLAARYRPEAVLPVLEATLAAGHGALQAIFRELQSAPVDGGKTGVPAARALELSLSPEEERELRDWDCPSDMDASVPTS